MRVGGILDLSTIDFPGRVCSVVFFAGCPFRCPYCQNHELLSGCTDVDIASIVAEIEKNFLIDGVCFTGGEPLVQDVGEMISLIKRLKGLGLDIKIDTNGYYPDRLARIVKHVDYVAIDIKTVPEKYSGLTGRPDSADRVFKSLSIVVDSGLDYEVRTTVVPTLVDADDVVGIAKILADFGVKRYVIQQFRNERVLDESLKHVEPHPKQYLMELGKSVERYVKEVYIR